MQQNIEEIVEVQDTQAEAPPLPIVHHAKPPAAAQPQAQHEAQSVHTIEHHTFPLHFPGQFEESPAAQSLQYRLGPFEQTPAMFVLVEHVVQQAVFVLVEHVVQQAMFDSWNM